MTLVGAVLWIAAPSEASVDAQAHAGIGNRPPDPRSRPGPRRILLEPDARCAWALRALSCHRPLTLEDARHLLGSRTAWHAPRTRTSANQRCCQRGQGTTDRKFVPGIEERKPLRRAYPIRRPRKPVRSHRPDEVGASTSHHCLVTRRSRTSWGRRGPEMTRRRRRRSSERRIGARRRSGQLGAAGASCRTSMVVIDDPANDQRKRRSQRSERGRPGPRRHREPAPPDPRSRPGPRRILLEPDARAGPRVAARGRFEP